MDLSLKLLNLKIPSFLFLLPLDPTINNGYSHSWKLLPALITLDTSCKYCEMCIHIQIWYVPRNDKNLLHVYIWDGFIFQFSILWLKYSLFTGRRCANFNVKAALEIGTCAFWGGLKGYLNSYIVKLVSVLPLYSFEPE